MNQVYIVWRRHHVGGHGGGTASIACVCATREQAESKQRFFEGHTYAGTFFSIEVHKVV